MPAEIRVGPGSLPSRIVEEPLSPEVRSLMQGEEPPEDTQEAIRRLYRAVGSLARSVASDQSRQHRIQLVEALRHAAAAAYTPETHWDNLTANEIITTPGSVLLLSRTLTVPVPARIRVTAMANIVATDRASYALLTLQITRDPSTSVAISSKVAWPSTNGEQVGFASETLGDAIPGYTYTVELFVDVGAACNYTIRGDSSSFRTTMTTRVEARSIA